MSDGAKDSTIVGSEIIIRVLVEAIEGVAGAAVAEWDDVGGGLNRLHRRPVVVPWDVVRKCHGALLAYGVWRREVGGASGGVGGGGGGKP